MAEAETTGRGTIGQGHDSNTTTDKTPSDCFRLVALPHRRHISRARGRVSSGGVYKNLTVNRSGGVYKNLTVNRSGARFQQT